MNTKFLTTTRLAGLLLLLSVLVLLSGVALIAAEDRLDGMSAAFRGVAPGRGDASGLRTIAQFALPYILLQLVGFALLTARLREAGDGGLGLAALVLVACALAIAALEGSFHGSVTVWAARMAERTGATPEFYEPLRRWVNGDVQILNMITFLAAMLLYSGSVLRTGFFPAWIGWGVLSYTVLAVYLYFRVFEAPAVIVPFPLLFGAGLLLRKSNPEEARP